MESGFSALPWESGFCFQPWNLGSQFCYRTRGRQGLAQLLANGLRFQYLLLQLVEFHAFLCAGRWRRGRLGPETSVVKPATSGCFKDVSYDTVKRWKPVVCKKEMSGRPRKVPVDELVRLADLKRIW